jgi:exodeoxyribonuclease VII small subunit
MAKSKKPSNKQPLNFEEALSELESLVAAMESGDMTLEESLQAFETGVRLTRECQQTLQQAEQKVQLLLAEDGTTAAFPSIESPAPGSDTPVNTSL